MQIAFAVSCISCFAPTQSQRKNKKSKSSQKLNLDLCWCRWRYLILGELRLLVLTSAQILLYFMICIPLGFYRACRGAICARSLVQAQTCFAWLSFAGRTRHLEEFAYTAPTSSHSKSPPTKQKSRSLSRRLFCLAGAEGLEPTTHGFGDQYSTNWATPLCTRCIIPDLTLFVNRL